MRFRCLTLLAVCSISLAGFAYGIAIKDAVFQTKNAGRVVFSHKAHIGKQGIENNCKVCHDGIFNLRKKASYTMADMEKGKSCGACHKGKAGVFSLKECARCHAVKEVTYQVKATGPTPFSHQKHLVVYANCSACHPKLFSTGVNKRATMADMERGMSCGFCHNGKKAFKVDQCSRCHKSPEVVYATPPVAKAAFSHTFHTQVYSCKDCHPTMVKPDKKQNRRVTMAEMEQGASCGVCHDGKVAFSVKGDCAKCHAGFKLPAKKTYTNQQGTIVGYFSHGFHTVIYQCSDCHTKLYPYGNAKRATMKQMESGASCGACHDGKSAFSVKADCLRCHKQRS